MLKHLLVVAIIFAPLSKVLSQKELSPEEKLYFKLLRKASEFDDLEEYDKMLNQLDLAIELLPNKGWAYEQKGNYYYYKDERNRYEAIKNYTLAIDRDPNYRLIEICYRMRASSYEQLGFYERALKDLTKLILIQEQENGNAGYDYKCRAEVKYKMELYVEALNDLAIVFSIEDYEIDADVFALRGEILLALGEIELAKNNFEQALSMDELCYSAKDGLEKIENPGYSIHTEAKYETAKDWYDSLKKPMPVPTDRDRKKREVTSQPDSDVIYLSQEEFDKLVSEQETAKPVNPLQDIYDEIDRAYEATLRANGFQNDPPLIQAKRKECNDGVSESCKWLNNYFNSSSKRLQLGINWLKLKRRN